jgi:hypothetical protein
MQQTVYNLQKGRLGTIWPTGRQTPLAGLWRYQNSWQKSGILIVVEGRENNNRR